MSGNSGSHFADTYTTEELIKLSEYLMRESNTTARMLVNVRDRCMLLMAAQMAFRGQNLRDLQWSDLFTARVPNRNAGHDQFFEVCGFLHP